MEIIDAHAHIYERLTGFGPKGEARAIGGGMVEWANGLQEKFLKDGHGEYGFAAEKLIELMDEANIRHAVLLQASNYGFQNSYVAEMVKKYPDRLTGAGTFDVYCQHAKAIFDNLIDSLNYRILKFEISEGCGLTGYHPDLKVDGKFFEPFLELCEERGVTVVFDIGLIDTKGFQINGISNIAQRYKNLTIVVAHSLFPIHDNRNNERLELLKLLTKDNIYFDIANLQAPKGDMERLNYIRNAMDIVGSERMMWGTDCPGIFKVYTYSELVDYVCGSGYFSEKELENVMGKTAKKVYKINI